MNLHRSILLLCCCLMMLNTVKAQDVDLLYISPARPLPTDTILLVYRAHFASTPSREVAHSAYVHRKCTDDESLSKCDDRRSVCDLARYR